MDLNELKRKVLNCASPWTLLLARQCVSFFRQYKYVSQAELDWVPVYVMCLVSEPEGPSFFYFGRMLEMSFKGEKKLLNDAALCGYSVCQGCD
jgi:lipocalin